MIRQTILLFLTAVLLLTSCKKKIHCYRPYFRAPITANLISGNKEGLDSIFILRLDTVSGIYSAIDTTLKDSLYFNGDTIGRWRWGYRGVIGILWEGFTYRISIPQRHLQLNITDISFEGDTGIFWDDVDHCGGNGTPQRQPKSFKVNGVRQESYYIRID